MTPIEEIEEWLERRLPKSYRLFLEIKTDDVTLIAGRLFGPANVIDRNESFESKCYCEGHLAIGEIR